MRLSTWLLAFCWEPWLWQSLLLSVLADVTSPPVSLSCGWVQQRLASLSDDLTTLTPDSKMVIHHAIAEAARQSVCSLFSSITEMIRSIAHILLIAFISLSVCAGSHPEKCGSCHSDSVIFKEWQTSGHANALKTLVNEPKARPSCLKCHSADYDRVRSNLWLPRQEQPSPETASNAVSCSSCHRHGTEKEKNLTVPVDKVCAACHVLHCGG